MVYELLTMDHNLNHLRHVLHGFAQIEFQSFGYAWFSFSTYGIPDALVSFSYYFP
jgi:hypothetical protein